MCLSVRRPYWKVSTAVSNRDKSTCFYILIYKNTSSQYSFSIYIDGAPYFVGIEWIVDNIDSLFVRESSVRILLTIFYPLARRMPLLKITSAYRTKRYSIVAESKWSQAGDI